MAGVATQQIDSAPLGKFREALRQRAAHPTRLIAIASLRQGLVSLLLLFVVLPQVTGRQVFSETLACRKMGSLSAFLNYRGTRDTLSVGLNEHQNLLTANWSRWAGNGWLRRTVGMGALTTAAIGLPIGSPLEQWSQPVDMILAPAALARGGVVGIDLKKHRVGFTRQLAP